MGEITITLTKDEARKILALYASMLIHQLSGQETPASHFESIAMKITEAMLEDSNTFTAHN